VQEGRIRNFPGDTGIEHGYNPTGPFYNSTDYKYVPVFAESLSRLELRFDPSLAVPTGPDNAPTNLSKRLWRRVN
jgi:hypothetical protein